MKIIEFKAPKNPHKVEGHHYTWNEHYAIFSEGDVVAEISGFDSAWSYSDEGEVRLMLELCDNEWPVFSLMAGSEDLNAIDEQSLRLKFEIKVTQATNKSLEEIEQTYFCNEWH